MKKRQNHRISTEFLDVDKAESEIETTAYYFYTYKSDCVPDENRNEKNTEK